MSMTTEQLLDRRRLRRKLAFWRFAGIVAIVLVIIGALVVANRDSSDGILARDQIARVSINGFIADDPARDKMFERLREAEAVKGVILSINSTGGSTAGGEALFEEIKLLAAEKPTVAAIGTVGASAAYMAAIAADRIVARRTSITGSIGVIFQYPRVQELLDNLGVEVDEVKSAPLKAAPSPFQEADPRARAVIAGLVRDSYNWFVDIVAEERGLERIEAVRLADGRVYSGRQALEENLIDEIGGEDQAIAWLESERGVEADLPIKDWQPDEDDLPFPSAAMAWLAKQAGLLPFGLGPMVLDRVLPERLALDGLVSVWHVSAD